jgi:mono/diheme cytochrome c family protein
LSSGEGKPGIGPPLIGCDWVKGSPERLVKISLYGVRGPIEVNGQEFNLEMPGVYYFQFDDEQMATVLSYVRHAWGNNASPVSAELVARVRAATGPRDSWTVEELNEAE